MNLINFYMFYIYSSHLKIFSSFPSLAYHFLGSMSFKFYIFVVLSNFLLFLFLISFYCSQKAYIDFFNKLTNILSVLRASEKNVHLLLWVRNSIKVSWSSWL